MLPVPHALANGVDPKTLAEILGHTNASFTLDTYAHVTSDMQKQAAVVTEDFMSNILGKGMKPWLRKDEQAEREASSKSQVDPSKAVM